MSVFHAAHFSAASVGHFSEQFLGPVDEEYLEEEAEDGLGYYQDGVKRTLTDEQIAIFRHSEIQALLRERRHAGEEMEYKTNYETADGNSAQGHVEIQYPLTQDLEDGELEDGSLTTDTPTPPASKPGQRMSKKEKKIQKAKQMGYFKQHVKPDLRKRTWDKVDTGLGSLDYDEDEGGSKAAVSKPTQRRRISYDD